MNFTHPAIKCNSNSQIKKGQKFANPARVRRLLCKFMFCISFSNFRSSTIKRRVSVVFRIAFIFLNAIKIAIFMGFGVVVIVFDSSQSLILLIDLYQMKKVLILSFISCRFNDFNHIKILMILCDHFVGRFGQSFWFVETPMHVVKVYLVVGSIENIIIENWWAAINAVQAYIALQTFESSAVGSIETNCNHEVRLYVCV